VTKVLEAIQTTLKPGRTIFVGGYAAFLAQLYGRKDVEPTSSDSVCNVV